MEWLGRFYRWLWSHVGGRPWTYILRDFWHKGEFFWINALISVGVWAGHHYQWRTVLLGLFLFSMGYLFGHLFWGTEYIPDQPGEPERNK